MRRLAGGVGYPSAGAAKLSFPRALAPLGHRQALKRTVPTLLWERPGRVLVLHALVLILRYYVLAVLEARVKPFFFLHRGDQEAQGFTWGERFPPRRPYHSGGLPQKTSWYVALHIYVDCDGFLSLYRSERIECKRAQTSDHAAASLSTCRGK